MNVRNLPVFFAMAAFSTACSAADSVSGTGKPLTTDKPVEMKFTTSGNPTFAGFGSADPSARVFGDRIYIYPSHDASPASRDWIMEDWHVYSSANLKDWTDHGAIVSGKDVAWSKLAKHCYAPDCIERNGKYYFYFPIGTRFLNPGATEGRRAYEIGVGVADSPTGPFRDPLGKPLIAADATPEVKRIQHIDPSPFIDDDGQAYLIWGNGTCLIAKLKPDMITLDGPIRQVPGLNGFLEGAWMHKKDGKYYLSYCNGGTGPSGRIDYAMGTEGPLGKFEYKGVVIASGNGFKGTAHHSIAKFKGKWYIFYHTLQPSMYYRKMSIDFLEYNDDGTIRRVLPTKTGVPPVE
jgi:arabinoxylan arabinofuranohydrolase